MNSRRFKDDYDYKAIMVKVTRDQVIREERDTRIGCALFVLFFVWIALA